MKWADFCISKISLGPNNLINEVVIHVDNDNSIGNGESHDRNWLVQQSNNNKTFCCIKKTIDGSWRNVGIFNYINGTFKWNTTLPMVLTKRKSFISYYHKDDEKYKTAFENLTGYLVVNKSVKKDDIDSENSDEYIKQLIQKNYLHDTTVLIVLISNKTKCRKHIDWEIAGALNYKVGDNYSGLLGLILPTHPDYGTGNITSDLMPSRLAANFKTGYAVIKNWTDDSTLLQKYIEEAFANRTSKADKRTNALPQMQKNTCE